MKRWTDYLCLTLTMLLAFTAQAKDAHVDARTLFASAQQRATQLDAATLITDYLEPAFQQARLDSDRPLAASTGIMLADQYRSSGMLHTALQTLELIDDSYCMTDHCKALLQREYALLYRATGDFGQARAAASAALALARKTGETALQASVLNESGSLAALLEDFNTAVSYLDEALVLSGNELSIVINRARVAIMMDDQEAAGFQFRLIEGQMPALPADRYGANTHLSYGVLLRDAQKHFAMPAETRLMAFDQFEQARQLAQSLHDTRLESYATGYIGGLYEDEQRYPEALQYSRRAAFLAQSVDAEDILYLWQWQIARAQNGGGFTEAAIIAYRQSIETLGRLKADLSHGSSVSFRERAAPVFFSFADLLLTRTATLQNPAEKEKNLREVRATLEQVKIAEVQEYFGDQCMGSDDRATELDRIGTAAAIIYPILLPDRTEILVSLPGGLRQFTSPVSARQLTAEVREFRMGIERYDGRQDYLRQARRLYNWLIEPMEAALAEAAVTTLVIVPDGPLRTIPLSALYDGKNFLVERFAMATTPGLTLTDPQPIERQDVQLLAGGLTESVQGFSALPNVDHELDSISAEFPSKTLRDQDFLVDEVERQISTGDQAIVHIATHGQFDSDHTKSFLLAYDDKFTMDRLQSTISKRQVQAEPLELLVLSACQTAAGDDRAALGLAGVALKAGARSALATLWFVNDESTSQLVTSFYAQLGTASTSKAQALQRAQLVLIRDPRFSHPAYWAPFLLIGNWL